MKPRKQLTTHELARLLLDRPDMPVITHANNHTTEWYCDARIAVGCALPGNPVQRPPLCIIGNFHIPRERDSDPRTRANWLAHTFPDFEVWSDPWESEP